MKKSIKPKTVKLLTVFFCAIYIVVLCILSWTSFYTYSHTKEEIAEKKSNLFRLEKDVHNLQEVVSKYKSEKKEFQKILFTERDVPAFLEKISSFAKDAKVEIVDMRTKQFKEVELPKEQKDSLSSPEANQVEAADSQKNQIILAAMPIEIKVEGKFENLLNFLTFIEKYRQLITLSDVQINNVKYPILESSFVLRIYSLKTVEQVKQR